MDYWATPRDDRCRIAFAETFERHRISFPGLHASIVGEAPDLRRLYKVAEKVNINS